MSDIPPASKENQQAPEESFEELLSAEQEFLHLLIRTIGVSRSDSHDVLQEANIYLIQNSSKFELGTNFRAWASQVVRYRCLSYFRAQKRRPMTNLSEQVLDLITQEVCEQYEETQRQLDRLEDCLAKLAPEQSTTLRAIYTDGLSLKEYANQTKKSHAAVRKTVSRLRQLLKQCIESYEKS